MPAPQITIFIDLYPHPPPARRALSACDAGPSVPCRQIWPFAIYGRQTCPAGRSYIPFQKPLWPDAVARTAFPPAVTADWPPVLSASSCAGKAEAPSTMSASFGARMIIDSSALRSWRTCPGQLQARMAFSKSSPSLTSGRPRIWHWWAAKCFANRLISSRRRDRGRISSCTSQPIKQVFSQAPISDSSRNIARGGRNNPHIRNHL